MQFCKIGFIALSQWPCSAKRSRSALCDWSVVVCTSKKRYLKPSAHPILVLQLGNVHKPVFHVPTWHHPLGTTDVGVASVLRTSSRSTVPSSTHSTATTGAFMCFVRASSSWEPILCDVFDGTWFRCCPVGRPLGRWREEKTPNHSGLRLESVNVGDWPTHGDLVFQTCSDVRDVVEYTFMFLHARAMLPSCCGMLGTLAMGTY